jgi:hypothetical protein
MVLVTGKMFWDGRNHLQCPCWGWKSRQNMSQPGVETITQTITKRSISPIGPGQTLRSNALAKNNRNNNELDSTAITVYWGPAYSIEIVLFGRFSSFNFISRISSLKSILWCFYAGLRYYKIPLSPRWKDFLNFMLWRRLCPFKMSKFFSDTVLCDGSIGTSAGIFKQSMGARNRGGIGLFTGLPGYTAWRNRFLGIDSWAP